MTFLDDLRRQLHQLRDEVLYKEEAPLTTAQAAHVGTPDGEVINLCANNYLGLADSPELIDAAKTALDRWGFGMASVRFICGTQTQHQELEARLTRFLRLGAEGFDTILYSSCFDANTGLFETLFGPDDAIISDELNHASIIDGVRLTKSQRLRYKNRDLTDLRTQLEAAKGARHRVIATDGVFSMDGYVAPLGEICALADEYNALVMVDDSHAVGFVGDTGAGTPELFGVTERVDILTGTLGKALGGASGGFTCAREPIVELLRQKSRPYLFSNSLAPAITAAAIAVLDLIAGRPELLAQLQENTAYFRRRIAEEGFEVPESDHPIVPVMIGDAALAARMADEILARGVYVRAFSFPVVPRGKARIRTQLSAALTRADLDRAVEAFVAARAAVA